MKDKHVTAIIPIYNEKNRIQNILKPLLKNPSIFQIILVDDHSTDKIDLYVKKHFPDITFLKNIDSKGKSEAVSCALAYVTTPFVLLLDGDLLGLSTENISQMVEPIVQYNYDVSISYRRRGSIKQHFVNFVDPLYNGERCMKIETLQLVFVKFNPKKYQLEACINSFILDNHLSFTIVPLDIKQVTKPKKRGLLKGVIEDFLMGMHITFSLGIWERLRQTVRISIRFQLKRLFSGPFPKPNSA